MFRDEGNDTNELGKKTVNCLLTDGGLGDHIASLVVVDFMVKTYPYINFLIWVPDYLLEFAKNLVPNAAIRNFTTAKAKYDGSKPGVNTRWDGRCSPMKMHLVDYAFHVLCDQHPTDLSIKNYLQFNTSNTSIQKYNLPAKYVVMTTGFTAPNREFYGEYINEVVAYIKAKGYDVVFLGKKDTSTGGKHTIKGNFSDKIDFTQGVDLIDKTNLMEAAAIMAKSECVVGLDNGLLHIAGCTDVPIIGGFTNVDPAHRMPVRHNELGWNFYPVVPPKSLNCRFCQSNMNFMYGNDFKFCYYKDYACLSQLKPELYIEQLEKVLK